MALHLLWLVLQLGLAGSIIDDVTGFFSSIPGKLLDLIDAIPKALSYIVHSLTDVFHGVAGAWGDLYNAAKGIGSELAGLADDTWAGFKHLITHQIPAAAEWALHGAGNLANVVKDFAAKVAKAAADAVHKALAGTIHTLENAVNGAIADVKKAVAPAINLVGSVGSTLVDWVGHPDHLAAALVEHIIFPILAWMIGHSVPLLRWFVKGAVSFTGEIAHDLEGELTKLF